MNWFPLLTFAGGILGVIGFEILGPWFSKRWLSSFDTGQWCTTYWLILGTLLVCTIGDSVRPEDVPNWAPMIVVALLHVAIHLFGYLDRVQDEVPNQTNSRNEASATQTSELTKEGSDDS